MSYDNHKNFAYSTVATAPSPATSGTSLTVASGDGSKFPATPFNAFVWPAGAQPLTSNAEIVRVTAKSTDTFTITRTQESTSARTIVIGDQIAAGPTAKTFTDIEALLPAYLTVNSTGTAPSATGTDAVALGPGTQANSSNTVAIGNNAHAGTGGYSVAIGPGANANSTGGSVAIGQSSSVTSNGNIAVGAAAAAGSNSGAIAMGYGATASGTDSIAIGGNYAGYIASATEQGAVAIGIQSHASRAGQFAYSTSRFAAYEDCQIWDMILGVQTTTAATTEMLAGNISSKYITLANDHGYAFDVNIVARRTDVDGEAGFWNLKFLVTRDTNAASTTIVGSVSKTVVAFAGGTGWDVNAVADTTNGRIAIQVTGEAAKTIRWVANCRVSEVGG